MSIILDNPKANPFQTITDSQWQAIHTLFPNPPKRTRGKPHSSWRCVMNSILYVLHAGGKWSALDKSPEYASKSSAHRWFVLWEKSGLLTKILDHLKEQSSHSISYPSRRKRLPAKLRVTEPILYEAFAEVLQRITA